MKNIKKISVTAIAFVALLAGCEGFEDHTIKVGAPTKLVYVPADHVVRAAITATLLGVVYDQAELTVMSNSTVHPNTTVSLAVDNSLIDIYNEENGTDYSALPSANLVLDGVTNMVIPEGAFEPESGAVVSFQGDPSALTAAGGYLIPLRLVSESGMAVSEQQNVAYVILTVAETSDMLRRSPSASHLSGTLVEDRSGWSVSTGNPEMFDDDVATVDAGFTQSTAHTFDLGQHYSITAFRFYAPTRPSTYVIEYSADNSTFTSLGTANSNYIYLSSGYQHIIPWLPVGARYLRITATGASTWSYSGMAEFDLYTE